MATKELKQFLLDQGIHPADTDYCYKHVNSLYDTYSIWQHGKRRQIEEPKQRLKKVQKALVPLFEQFPLHPAATAIKGGGTVPNVAPHEGAKHVLKVDIKSCYSNIDSTLVGGQLTDPLMRDALTLCLIQKHKPGSAHNTPDHFVLPTGAPTSPILCNIALTPLDYKVAEIAELFGFKYTRYLDDLTLSTHGDRYKELLRMVRGLIEKQGLPINHKKSRWATRGKDSVIITGIALGENGTVAPRGLRRMLRARLQNIAKSGEQLDDATKGYLAYLRAIDTAAHEKLLYYYQKRIEYASPQ